MESDVRLSAEHLQRRSSSMDRKRLRLPALGGVLLVAVGCAVSIPARTHEVADCRVLPFRFDTLAVAGDPVYVEPLAVREDGRGRLLIAGKLNYRFRRDGQHWTIVDSTGVFGLVVDGSEVRTVPPPLPGRRFDGIRAVGRANGWQIVFAEVVRKPITDAPDSATALWYGEFDGASWNHLEQLPSPELPFLTESVSGLWRSGESIVWAVPTRTGAVLLLTRSNGSWRGQIIATVAGRAEPFIDSTGELYLATIQSDTTLPVDGSSLLLRAEHPEWGVRRVLRSSSIEQVEQLAAFGLDDRAFLTWEAVLPEGTSAARALEWTPGRSDRILTVDSSIQTTSAFSTLTIPGFAPLWVTTHRDPVAGSSLQFASLSPTGSIRPLGRLENPFVAATEATSLREHIVVAGAIAPGRRYVATLLLYLDVRCQPAAGHLGPVTFTQTGG